MNKEKLFAFFQYILPQQFISKQVGKLADSKIGFIKNAFIKFFLKNYDIKMHEAVEEDAFAYANFNDFFTRALKPDARIIDANPKAFVSPVDGAISQFGNIELAKLIQAKGIDYSLLDLVGRKSHIAEKFYNGKFATIYLSPSDYHRIHIPTDATLVESVFIPGRLFSVNSATTSYKPKLFTKNERLVCVFKDAANKEFALILVGALIVGSIETVWAGQITPKSKEAQVLNLATANQVFKKAAEIARFKLGSTVIVLTPPDYLTWRKDLQLDANVKLGETLGLVCE